MTEYEYMVLFLEFAQAASSVMANYMTLVFAMLVTSYMAAHRLDRLMMWIALVMYSLFALGFCNEIFQIYSDLSRLGIRISEVGNVPTTSLGWFGPLATSPDFLYVMPNIIGSMIVAAYAGSIIFFFRARKANISKTVGPIELGDFIDNVKTDNVPET